MMMDQYLTNYLTNPQYGSTRDGFGQGLKEAGELDKKIIALCADLTESTRVNSFKKAFPTRFIEVGIQEENMVGIAAGLALTGKIPFAVSYAIFVVNNALGPIRSSVCYSNTNVKIIGGSAGFSSNTDGATHQSLEDIAYMRTLPNMTVVVPCDQEEARKATHAIAKIITPCYLRVGKHKTLKITTTKTPFEIGKAIKMKRGSDLTMVACGTMVGQCLKVANKLKNDYSIEVINMHTIKPFDQQTLFESIKKTKALLSVEEHQVSGGLGSRVAEFISQTNINIPFKIIGINDNFGESGDLNSLYKKHGLDEESIEKSIKLITKSKEQYGK